MNNEYSSQKVKFLFWVRVTLKEEGHVIQTGLLKQRFKDKNEDRVIELPETSQ